MCFSFSHVSKVNLTKLPRLTNETDTKSSMLSKWIYIISLVFLAQIEALRVLVVFPFPSTSHNLLGRATVQLLLAAHHEVVHITSFPYNKPITNLTEISIEALGAEMLREVEETRLYSVERLMGTKGNTIISRSYYTYSFHKKALENENMTRFLSDPKEKFDVILIEWFFSDLFAGIPPLFKCPFIWLASTDAHWQILSLSGEVTNPAYTPEIFEALPDTLWGRASKLMSYVKKYFITKIIFSAMEKSSYNAIYPSIAAKRGVSMPPYNEAVYNASLVFINSQPAAGNPYNLPLNVKYIGGYHMDTDLKPMPTHLQKIMDNAEHGVIFFCLGTNVESKFMSKKMSRSLLTMFSKLRQAVVWKYEDVMENVPANVYLEKWVPQLNILAHPNLKIFITHGGRMSITEAVHYGVPIIGIPVFGDQFVNVQVVVEKRMGIEVTLTEDLAGNMGDAIKKILDNPMYLNKARELSSIYRHRLTSPGQELVYWTEHVVKSRGAQHFSPISRNMPWYQKLYLDLILALIFVIFLADFIFYFVKKMVKAIMKEKRS